MTIDELRAKFEAWFDREFRYVNMSIVRGVASAERCYKEMAWAGYQAAHASRDAEVEALRTDAERHRKMREIAFEYAGGIHWIGIDNDFKFTDYRFDLDKTVDAAMRE